MKPFLDLEACCAEVKLARTARPPSLCGAGAEAQAELTYRLRSARNQTVGMQVMVYARDGQPIRDLQVQTDGPVSVYRATYVDCPYSGRSWPDPLPPFEGCDVEAGTVQPLWFDVHAAADQPAGDHEIVLRFSAATHRQTLVRLDWRVSPMALPTTPALATAVGVNPDMYLLPWFAQPQDRTRQQQLLRLHFDALIEHGLSPYSWQHEMDQCADFDFIAQDLADPRVTTVRMPACAGDDNGLAQAAARARQLQAYHKAYWYPYDEPATPEGYAAVRQAAQRLHRVVGAHRLVVPFWCREKDTGRSPVAAMDGACNVWCAVSPYAAGRDEPIARELDQQLAKGCEKWAYVCNGPLPPMPNLFLEQGGIDHRIIFWQLYAWQCMGFLYWCANRWPAEALDAAADVWSSVLSRPSCPYHGDGVLLYPGTAIGRDEPVASQRLKIIRRGVDDYTILKMYERACGPDAARQMVMRVAPDLTLYERLPDRVNGLVGDMMKQIAAVPDAAPAH